MENIDTLSHCSSSSNLSNLERLSAVSALSNLSTYQGEFLELRHLIDSPPFHSSHNGNKHETSNNSDSNSSRIIQLYEERISNLTSQLQNSLKQNEKYKNQIFTLEKNNELFVNDKIETLLKNNRGLEKSLDDANVQIERLLNNYIIHGGQPKISQLQGRIIELEKCNREMMVQNSDFNREINQLKFQHSVALNENKNVRVALSDLHLELDCKSKSIVELKQTITGQHIEHQTTIQENTKIKHLSESLKSEIQCLKKSEEWFKTRLDDCHSEKVELLARIGDEKSSKIELEKQVDDLKLELNRSKCRCEEIKLTALKEKESILKRLEAFSTPSESSNNFKLPDKVINNDEALKSNYEVTIRDLSSEVSKVKIHFEEQDIEFEKLRKQYSDLMSKYLTIQNQVRDRENSIEKLESDKGGLKMKISLLLDQANCNDDEILRLKTNISELKVELDSKNREMSGVKEFIKTVKEQFNTFRVKYDGLKQEVHQKAQEMLRLQVEKQDLFMKNNWKTCELEKFGQLEVKIREMTQVESDLRRENDKLTENVQAVSAQNSDLLFQIRDLQGIVSNQREQFEGNVRELVEKSEIIDKVCQMCQIDDSTLNYQLDSKSLLIRLDDFFKKNQQLKSDKDEKIRELQTKAVRSQSTLSRIDSLKNRCRDLQSKVDEASNTLVQISNSPSNSDDLVEQIKKLHVQLQVKTREDKDKQKRYETNCRTLLRKVKEHMRGRNRAEKHSLYLRQLYDQAVDDLNSLKLQLGSRDLEIDTLRNCIEELKRANGKLKCAISDLELAKNKSQSSHCNNCVILVARNREIELELRNCEQGRREDSQQFTGERHSLLVEIEDLRLKLSDLVACKQRVCEVEQRNGNLQVSSDNYRGLVDDMEIKLRDLMQRLNFEQENSSNLCSEKNIASLRLEEVCQENLGLRKELELLDSSLQQSVKELSELKFQRDLAESSHNGKISNIQNLVLITNSQIKELNQEIDALKRDKFFLQRLCNDLKTTLKFQIDQNKVMKDQIVLFAKDVPKDEFSSLPARLLNFPSPKIQDMDSYVDKLLRANEASDKPFSDDIQGCIDTLRQEIIILQKQITGNQCTNGDLNHQL